MSSEREGTNQVGLVDATGIDRSTTADLVRRLMRKGLLARRRARHDARSNVLRLTEEGKALLSSFRARAAEVDQMLLNALPETSRSPFVDALGRIAAINPGTRPEHRSQPARGRIERAGAGQLVGHRSSGRLTAACCA